MKKTTSNKETKNTTTIKNTKTMQKKTVQRKKEFEKGNFDYDNAFICQIDYSPYDSIMQEVKDEINRTPIAKSVYKKGIKPKNLIQPEIRTLEDELAEAVGEAIVLNLQFGRESKDISLKF